PQTHGIKPVAPVWSLHESTVTTGAGRRRSGPWRKHSMNSRTRTLATLFTLAMAAMLLGAAVTTQIRPVAALARSAEPETAASVQRGGGPVTLDTFRDVARSYTAGVVNINT